MLNTLYVSGAEKKVFDVLFVPADKHALKVFLVYALGIFFFGFCISMFLNRGPERSTNQANHTESY